VNNAICAGSMQLESAAHPAITKGFVPTEFRAGVRSIACPVIYVLGGASSIVPAQTREQLRRVLPQMQIVSLPGLGRYPSEKNPVDFLAIADRFLAQSGQRN
jgi:pimeloyl-ACP methyl ester carboxylesterase